MYLLDTDILSNLIRSFPRPGLFARVAATPGDQLYTSSISVGELIYGAFRKWDNGGELLAKITHVVLLRHPMLPFDTASARIYGEVRAGLERRGNPIGDSDTRIAAIALANGLTVVTGNVRHFSSVPGLRVENWLV